MDTNYTWERFNALDFDLRDGAVTFWEPGYNYDDPDFWSSYEDPRPEFIKAVQMYDWLKKNDPDGE